MPIEIHVGDEPELDPSRISDVVRKRIRSRQRARIALVAISLSAVSSAIWFPSVEFKQSHQVAVTYSCVRIQERPVSYYSWTSFNDSLSDSDLTRECFSRLDELRVQDSFTHGLFGTDVHPITVVCRGISGSVSVIVDSKTPNCSDLVTD